MQAFVLFLILLKVLGSIQTTISSDEYDITKTLNDTIAEIFHIGELQFKIKLPSVIVNSDGIEDTVRSIRLTSGSHCPNIHISHAKSNISNMWLSYGFLDGKIQLHSPELALSLSGTMKGTIHYWGFASETHLRECKISAIKQSTISGDSILVDLQYDNSYTTTSFHDVIKHEEDPFKRLLPSILKSHMNRNYKLLKALDDIYNNLSTKLIASKHPYFLGHEDLYHYLIPNIPLFASFNLKNITMGGLGNFHSFIFTLSRIFDKFAYTLLLKDIRGSMILENVGRTTKSNLELQFFIGSLSICINQNSNCSNTINVRADNYSVTEKKLNNDMTYLDLMDHIEWAIGSSLMPSLKYEKTKRPSHFSSRSKMETAIRALLVEESFQPIENNTEELNEKSTISKQPKKDTTTNIYQISFPSMTINLLSGNLMYPDQMQCASPTNYKSTYRLNLAPAGKRSSKSNESNTIDVNFNINYPSIKISSIKPVNSGENNSCEFQIRNNRDIEVELSPSTYSATESKEQLEMKKKIDTTLRSMTIDRMVRTVKPAICLPFDVCAQTLKLVDNFFSGFIDVVLKKCSFRRNINTEAVPVANGTSNEEQKINGR